MVLCIVQQMTWRGVVEAIVFPSRVVAGTNKKNLVVLGIVEANVARRLRVGSSGRIEVVVLQRWQGQIIDGRGMMCGRRFLLRKIVHGIGPRREQIDARAAGAVNFQRT